MKAIYEAPRDCLLCLDAPFDGAPPCNECIKDHRHEVEIISTHSGLFEAQALILLNGEIKQVAASKLKMISPADAGDGENG